MGTVINNRGTSCVGVCKTGNTLIRVSTVMGTLYMGQILEEKVKKLLPDAVVETYLSGDALISS